MATIGHFVSEETKRKIALAHIKTEAKECKGYLYQYAPYHPYRNKHKYVMEHRLIAESILGRYLCPEEQVHHINGDTRDNRPENLGLFNSNSHHYGYHVRKLTQKEAEQIRGLYQSGNYSQRMLAKRFGIARGSIRKILENVTYRTEVAYRKLT